MAEVKRSVRIGERLREELAALLVRDVQDPRVRGVIVTMVRMTADLQLARVRVRLPELDARDEVAHRKALLAGLESASGMLRRELGRRLGLRYAPKLAFYFDEAPEKRDRIDALLAEIEREGKKPEGE